MTESSKVLITSIIITAVLVFLTTTGSVLFLYRTAVKEQKERLFEFVKTEAAFITVVHDAMSAGGNKGFPEEQAGCSDDLVKVFLQLSELRQEGQSGKKRNAPVLNFIIAEKLGDEVLYHAGTKKLVGSRVPFVEVVGYPMGSALSGESGVLKTMDHMGRPILCAYTGVDHVAVGIVAKIFLDDLRRPFIQTGLVAVCSAVVLLLTGFLVKRKVVAPFVADLADQKTNLAQKNVVLEEKVIRDHLTGLYNRQYLNERLERSLAEEGRRVFSIIMFDLDHFKRINDTLGHLAGDQVLMDLAALVRESIRQGDVLARWGGEEFVILLEGADSEAAARLAEKLCRKVRGAVFGPDQHVTCSFGVTGFLPGDTAISVVNRADQLLYKAKASGRDRVVWQ